MSHHILANDKQFKVIRQGDQVEKQKEAILKELEYEKSHMVYVEDRLVNPTDSIKQLGNYMDSAMFEKKLASILPYNIAFIDNPFRQGFRAIIRPASPQLFYVGYETLCPYERGIIPEHSIMQLVEKEIPDPDVISRKKTVSRKDLGKFDYKPGQGFVFDDSTVRPGFIKVKTIGHEIKRGWRTILLKLILAQVITLTDAERVFGSKDHPSWAGHTGKLPTATLPW